MELLAVAHLAQDVFKEELMDVEERVKAAVDADLTAEAYWEVAEIVKGMPEGELRDDLTNALDTHFGNVMRRAV